ncbi:MAG: ABC transporter ATP-binding protein [Verrucomicrobia bacterium]|nr:ABC transporter ATP-binding protein [Verrucomicrobiota bacterium]
MSVAVNIDRVSKRFANTRAVDAVSLHIAAGELFFLLGPSGCGKTTLLRCLAGFYTPDEGSIRIGDRDVTLLPPHVRDTGMVFQSYALWPHFTVAQNVSFGLEMRGVARPEREKRVDEALELVRMRDRAKDKPNQLSGGQQQRVALARALVVRPQCLLLDEPLSNLDAKLRLEMRSEIRRICKESGLTAIYVTHDQKEALSIADRLAVMHQGKLCQVGKPRDVYQHPANRFVANFIGETNFLEGLVTESATGRVRVQTAIGELFSTARADAGVVHGARVTVSVRPEVIRFDSPPADAPNVLDATLHDTVYLGEIAQHQVRIPSHDGVDAEWKAFDLNPRVVAGDRAERAQLWVAPEDVIVLGS